MKLRAPKKPRSLEVIAAIQKPAGRMRHRNNRRPLDARRRRQELE